MTVFLGNTFSSNLVSECEKCSIKTLIEIQNYSEGASMSPSQPPPPPANITVLASLVLAWVRNLCFLSPPSPCPHPPKTLATLLHINRYEIQISWMIQRIFFLRQNEDLSNSLVHHLLSTSYSKREIYF